MADRTAASAGFVLAGVALAASLSAGSDVLDLVAAALAAVALAAFALRRYGRLDPGPANGVAAGAGIGTAAVAVGSLVTAGSVSLLGPGLAAVAAVGAAVLAYADWLGVDRSGLLSRTSRALSATAIGLTGLVAIFAWSFVVGSVYRSLAGEIGPATAAALSAIGLGLGTGSVAWLYLRWSGRGLAFVDLRRPTRRDAAYVVVGVVVLLGVNLGIGWVFEQLGLEAAQHSVFEVAREDPSLLLVYIPLSVLLIGPGEELLYRNVVQKSLYGPFTGPAAVVVASTVFAVAHVPAYSSAGATSLSILNTLTVVFALSIVLGVVFLRTRNVLVPALVHGSFNAIAFAATYAEFVT